ncbi:MAG: hydroxymethylglutaryl-CoA lyase [Proteobacteria bacterium]|nr:hydroxymethylglutaryl-CoA lyase [Pseudomonadota bacterium]MDA1331438.1 hydroxymethylglutaryl-CoA lyase [Pseudomonadota bacterium]
MSIPNRVKIVEVGPRDGLQNEKVHVPTDIKVELINKLADAGLSVIEVGSFVSSKWVPQMADTREVFIQSAIRSDVCYPVLVPNLQGLEAAIEAGVQEIAGFAAASEMFSQKNTNCTIKESLKRQKIVCDEAIRCGLRVRGYISVVLGCPYEGAVDPAIVVNVAQQLYEMGCYEISLGDTVGVGTPQRTRDLFEHVTKVVPIENLGGHFHDTYGQAIGNIFSSLEVGVSIFDSSIAGLGGCPYSPGATGNVSTEDVLYMLDGMGIETGIDMNKLLIASEYICEHLGRSTFSRAGRAILSKRL